MWSWCRYQSWWGILALKCTHFRKNTNKCTFTKHFQKCGKFIFFSWLCCLMYMYIDSKRVSILIEAVLPTLPTLYLPFNVYLDSKRVSILIDAVLPTLPTFNVYLDSKRVSFQFCQHYQCMYQRSFNVYLDSKRVSILHRSSFANITNITNVVPSLQCISWFKESKHTHRSSFANITNVVPSLQCISSFKESKHTYRSSFTNITNGVPSL